MAHLVMAYIVLGIDRTPPRSPHLSTIPSKLSLAIEHSIDHSMEHSQHTDNEPVVLDLAHLNGVPTDMFTGMCADMVVEMFVAQ